MKKLSEINKELKDSCISEVTAMVVTDKGTNQDNLRQKIQDSVHNYLITNVPGFWSKADIETDIVDEVEKKLKKVSFNSEPNISVAARVAREKIQEQPENKYIRLR